MFSDIDSDLQNYKIFFFDTNFFKSDGMKIIQNRIIPFGRRYLAINLFGVLFAKGPCDRTTINHEKIHTRQMQELLYIPFYIIYVLEWLVRLARHRDPHKAYINISFEREAYANQHDFNYLTHRRPFSSARYL